MEREMLFEKVSTLMADLFGLQKDQIRPESRFIEDLDLTSLDAIDLVVELQQMTGTKVKDERLRNVRTVADIVALVETQLTSP
jgi:acyl carrier protein